MSTLNVQTAFTGAAPTVWRLQAIEDRKESTVLEWLKDYTNAIIRDDDNEGMLGYPSPNEGYTRSYQVKRRLMGTGVSGTTALRNSEELRMGNAFTFTNTFRRHAVAHNITVPATDILEAEYAREERRDLAEWAGRKKEKVDISRMLTGAMVKYYGNGDSSTYAGISNVMVLNEKTFTVVGEGLKAVNGKPIEMLPDVDGRVSYRFYVMLVDETNLGLLSLDSGWQTFIEAFNVNAGFNSPLSRVSYGKRHNVVVIPIEKEEGFGSPLRPELIVAADASAISNSANADITVGLPSYASGTNYTDYTPDGKIAFTEYLSDFLTAAGATSSGIPCSIIKATGVIVTGMTVKLGSTNTAYTINLANASGSSYTPEAGDKIISLTSVVMGLGAEAYISSYPSQMWFSGQKEDYDFEQGLAINFWEGGALVQNVRKIKNGVLLNFIYSALLV